MTASDALFRSLIGTTPDAIVTMDEDGRVVFINPAGERMFGYSAAELVGQPLTIIMPEDQREQHRVGLRRYLQTGTRRLDWANLRLPGLRRDGTRIPLSVSFGEYEENGKRVFTGILRDVSEAVEREAALRFLLDASEVLTTSLDYEHTLKSVAELATRSIADWAVVDLVEGGAIRRVAVAHPDPEKLRMTQELQKRYPANPNAKTGVAQVIRTGQRIVAPEITEDILRAIAIDATHLRLLRELNLESYMSVPLKLREEVIGALTLVSGSPARRYSDRDADLAEELARRATVAIDNAKLYRAAEAARIAAERANLAKSEFLAMMSHELRTPLNAISGYADLLAAGVRGELTPEQLADVRSIQRSQSHLLAIINDILNFAKLDAGKVQFNYEMASAHALMQGLRELIQPQLAQKQMRYEYVPGDTSATIEVDPEKLQQVMLNLLTNAVKYTDPGGTVRLAWTIEGDDFVAAVSDTGRGIPGDKLQAIFEPFVQVEQLRTREQGGAGLGLAISRDITRAMDGDISVESRVGEGSTFTVRLPRKQRRRR